MTDFRPGRFQVLPTIVKNLLIINVIMVLLQLLLASTFHVNLQTYLGLHYWRSDYFKPWQLLTHMFMHGSPFDFQATVLHLFSNMFALWMFGSVLENLWGPKRFLTFYLICGLGAALCYMGTLAVQYEPLYKSFQAFKASPTLDHFLQFVNQNGFKGNDAFKNAWSNDPGNMGYPAEAIRGLSKEISTTFDAPMVGASGAVFGVLFAFGYLFPNTLLYFYFFIPIKAKWFIAFYALFELYAGIRNSADDNVAHFAHLGGMLFAFVLLKIWNSRYRQRFY